MMVTVLFGSLELEESIQQSYGLKSSQNHKQSKIHSYIS